MTGTDAGARAIETAPKAELHVHIEGTLEPEMLLRLAERNGVAVPHRTVEDVRATYEFPDLAGFSAIYQRGLQVLRTERDFYELTQAYMRRAHRDRVVHAEVFLSPQGHVHRGVAFEAAVEGVLAGVEDAKRELGMTGGVILGTQRYRSVEDGQRMFEQARRYRDRVLGLGLGGVEVGFPPSLFARLFAQARDLGWRNVAHAGEEGPPAYIAEALDLLKVERIDHGVRCEEDPALARRLAEQRVPLTVCPLSNVKIGVFPSLERHNLARLLRAGLCVTVNSDDPPYFGGYVNDNYVESARALGLSQDEQFALARNGFEAAFIDAGLRSRYLAELDAHRAAAGAG